MACLTDCMLISWIGLEGVATDCFACNNGTWTGTETYTNCTPMCTCMAARFDGCSVILLANECNFDIISPANAFSMSAWVKSSVDGEQFIIGKSTQLGSLDAGWYFGNRLTGCCRIEFGMKNSCFGIGSIRICMTGVFDGCWHHVALTKPASTAPACSTLYVDGIVGMCIVTSGTYTGGVNNRQVSIGAGETLTRPICGDIDEVNIWSIELTSCDILRLYNVGSGIKYVDLPFDFPPSCAPTKFVSSEDITRTISRGDNSNIISSKDVSNSISIGDASNTTSSKDVSKSINRTQ